MRAIFEWSSSRTEATSLERRIAAICFPLSADYVAPCYGRVANERLLDQVLKYKTAIDTKIPEEVALFRVITAAIILAITSCLVKEGFKGVQHSTCLDLNHEGWIKPVADVLDKAFHRA